MKRGRFLLLAALVVLVANGSALYQAYRNRTGPADCEVTLSEREVTLVRPADQSGVFLRLNWARPGLWLRPGESPAANTADWLDATRLCALGFDCSVPPSDPAAAGHYSLQPALDAYVALRVDSSRPEGADTATRLVALDISRDAVELRKRHSDRSAVLILPVSVHIGLRTRAAAGRDPAGSTGQPRIEGRIIDYPPQIHVPRPYSDLLRKLPAANPRFHVRLRWGALHEPWIVGVIVP